MNWPQALIAELAARRCIVFLGAGASAGCHPQIGNVTVPTWNALLASLRDLAAAAVDVVLVNRLLQQEKYLDAAEIILAEVPSGDFSAFIRNTFDAPHFQPSEVHKAILQIDPKVVITTNFDEIYDLYCRLGDAAAGYNICRYYDSHLVADLRSPVRLIVKAHGCISDTARIILTRSNFLRQRQDYANFFHVLNGLFLTHTLFFVGYSLSDPDIQLVLENATIAAASVHPHYAAIPSNMPPALKAAAQTAYNLYFIEFAAGNYAELEAGLRELAEDVMQFRVDHPD